MKRRSSAEDRRQNPDSGILTTDAGYPHPTMPISRYLASLLVGPRQRREKRLALQELRRSLLLIVDLDAMAASLANRLHEIFDPGTLAIFERRGSHLCPLLVRAPETLEPSILELSSEGRLIRWFEVNQICLNPTIQRDVHGYLGDEERRFLDTLDCQLCAPLIAKNRVIGLLLLGTRANGIRYRSADSSLLLQIAEQASLAFQNATLYRKQEERLDRLHRADRLAAVGQLAAGVAHEVRNPLTAIRSTMQYLAGSMEGERQELVDGLIEEVDRIDHIIDGLLGLSRSEDLRHQNVDLAEVLAQTLRLVDIRARKQGVRIEPHLTSPLRATVDPNRLKQVFLNLLLNALQAMPEGGEIRVRCGQTARIDSPGEDWALVVVEDNGPGIAEEDRPKVLDPFFTTKKEGTGLGLSICQNMIEQHGGTLRLDSEPGRGTRLSILLPLNPTSHNPSSPTPSSPRSKG